MTYVDEGIALQGKRVLLRVDLNVSIANGKVTEQAKLQAAVESIQYIRKQGGIVTLATHLGRPEGKIVHELSTGILIEPLKELLRVGIVLINQFGSDWQEQVAALSVDQIGLLENVQFSPGETANDSAYAAALAAPFDLFVMDCFGQSHRAYASIVGIAAQKETVGGLLVKKELAGLTPLLDAPKSLFVVIIGGAKMSTKLPVIEEMSKRADAVILGGGIVNTVLAAKGYAIGDSITEPALIRAAKEVMSMGRVVMPVDVVVGSMDGKTQRVVRIEDRTQICRAGESILDIGPESIRICEALVAKSATVLWNGALGYFEQKPYNAATKSLVGSIAAATKRGAQTVIGGGETLQAMNTWASLQDVSFASTGGGAMLTMLSGKPLPGISALK